jgi:hypothetical protein
MGGGRYLRRRPLHHGAGLDPQQDVFQRASSSKTERIAVWGTVIGGTLYFVFAAVPIYLTYAATLVDPAMTTALLADDAQLVLPTFVKAHLPLYAQIIFYGALLSVIMSTASGTLLAPSVTISENIIKEFMPHHRISQKKLLWITRMSSSPSPCWWWLTRFGHWNREPASTRWSPTPTRSRWPALSSAGGGLYWKRASNLGAGCPSYWIRLAAMEFIAPSRAATAVRGRSPGWHAGGVS